MRTGAASAVDARCHNENDVTMTIAGLWREREFICHKIQKTYKIIVNITIVAGYQIGKPIKLVAAYMEI